MKTLVLRVSHQFPEDKESCRCTRNTFLVRGLQSEGVRSHREGNFTTLYDVHLARSGHEVGQSVTSLLAVGFDTLLRDHLEKFGAREHACSFLFYALCKICRMSGHAPMCSTLAVEVMRSQV